MIFCVTIKCGLTTDPDSRDSVSARSRKASETMTLNAFRLTSPANKVLFSSFYRIWRPLCEHCETAGGLMSSQPQKPVHLLQMLDPFYKRCPVKSTFLHSMEFLLKALTSKCFGGDQWQECDFEPSTPPFCGIKTLFLGALEDCKWDQLYGAAQAPGNK